jgi:hypothetical protein
MKQIGLAFMSYVQDYDETFPGEPGEFAVDPNNRGSYYDVIWPFVVSPYIGGKVANAANSFNQGIYVCPSNDLIQGLDNGDAPDYPGALPIIQTYGITEDTSVTPPAYRWHCSYSINDAVVGEADNPTNAARVNGTAYASWRQPAQEYLLMEAGAERANERYRCRLQRRG